MVMFRKVLQYVFSFNLSKQLFNALLPQFARRKIATALSLDTGPLNRKIDDVEVIPVQADSYLVVYMKHYSKDVGPGVSLYVLENEILRFDCFGTERGHYHSLPCLSAVPSKDRIYFATDTVAAQINQTVEEITSNHAAHLKKHFRRRIRDFEFNQARLETAVAEARDKMLSAHHEGSSTALPRASIVAASTSSASHRSHS